MSESTWFFNETHKVFEHEKFWEWQPILKPSPREAERLLAQIKTGTIEDSVRFDAIRFIPHLKKLCRVRDELGVYSALVDNQEEIDNRVFFIDHGQELNFDAQLVLLEEYLCKDSLSKRQFCNNFLLLGMVSSNERRILFVCYKHHQRSISTKIMREFCSIVSKTNIERVVLVTATPVTKTCATAMSIDYPQIEIELWSDEELLFDWFSNGIVHPMSVIRSKKCNHYSLDGIEEEEVEKNGDSEMTPKKSVCQNCQENYDKTLMKLKDEVDSITAVLTSCMVAKKLRLTDGDILDYQRGKERIIRRTHEYTADAQ